MRSTMNIVFYIIIIDLITVKYLYWTYYRYIFMCIRFVKLFYNLQIVKNN